MIDLGPIWLSLALALITTGILFLIAIPLSFWLSNSSFKLKPVIETLISMPLVLPPTVIGFYLLLAFSPNNIFGDFLLNSLGLDLLFSFKGLVFASVVYSLPFMVNPIKSGINSLPDNYLETSYVLGKSKITSIFKVILPNIKPSILTAIVLTFAHTIGEFGVVLMIGGNIPGKTRIASIAIYDQVESLNYANANMYSLILFVMSFIILLSVFMVNKKSLNRIFP